MRRKGWWKIANLTPKQKKFADEYIITGNATQSAIEAGYSKKYANTNASKLLQNTTIKEYIAERFKQIESHKIATADEVLQVLTSIIRLEFTEEQQTINPLTGKVETLENKPTTKDVISASKELLKRYPLLNTDLMRDKLVAEVAKAEAEARIAQNKADKLTSDEHTDELLKALINPPVKEDSHDDTVQS